MPARKFWTEKEDEFLKSYYPTKGYLWCAKALSRTQSSIANRIFGLKLKHSKTKPDRKPSGHWTFEHCLEDARPHRTLRSWRDASPSGYASAYRMGYMEKIKSLLNFQTLGNLKHRFVYAYEFNDGSVYVGLTGDLERRHLFHINSKRFTVEKKGIDFKRKLITPEPIEAEKASKLEISTIQGYESKFWIILNRAKGGALGSDGVTINTEEHMINCAKQCKTMTEFQKKFAGAYQRAREIGILSKITSHMRVVHRNLSDEELILIAKKCDTLKLLKKTDYSAYIIIHKRNLQSVAFKHMNLGRKPNGHWQNKENLRKDALLYDTKWDWHRNSNTAYGNAVKQPYFDEITSHMTKYARKAY